MLLLHIQTLKTTLIDATYGDFKMPHSISCDCLGCQQVRTQAATQVNLTRLHEASAQAQRLRAASKSPGKIVLKPKSRPARRVITSKQRRRRDRRKVYAEVRGVHGSAGRNTAWLLV